MPTLSMLNTHHSTRGTRLCAWHRCRGCDSPCPAGDLTVALGWLQPFKSDVSAMLALRHSLLECGEAADVLRQGDDLVLQQVAALVASGRLRVCGPARNGEARAPVDSGAGSGAPETPAPPPPNPQPRPRPQPQRRPGHLVVTVIDDEDGTVVANLPVDIKGPQELRAPSASDGKARFNGIEPGGYRIDHHDPCFKPAHSSAFVVEDETAQAELRVLHIHAAITIKEITFSGHNVVEKDTLGPFGAPHWVLGRGQIDQSPVAYARNKKMPMAATFKVTTTPCRPEAVQVRATGNFGPVSMEWTGSVTVNPGDTEVSTTMTCVFQLGNSVGAFENSELTWRMNPAGRGFASAGTSANTVYVTLGDPVGTPSHWTLLDISCRAAAGATDADTLAARMFVPFTGRNIRRKRDDHALTYWKPPQGAARNTLQLLGAKLGNGECGSWAELFRDMFRAHGVTSAVKVEILRSLAERTTIGFLVKNWNFQHPPASSATAFTHLMWLQATPNQIPGQSNTAPPPAFFNHFIVHFNGKFYDPSYGAGPFTTQNQWEAAGVAGLFREGSAQVPAVCGFDTSLPTGRLMQFWNTQTGTRFP